MKQGTVVYVRVNWSTPKRIAGMWLKVLISLGKRANFDGLHAPNAPHEFRLALKVPNPAPGNEQILYSLLFYGEFSVKNLLDGLFNSLSPPKLEKIGSVGRFFTFDSSENISIARFMKCSSSEGITETRFKSYV